MARRGDGGGGDIGGAGAEKWGRGIGCGVGSAYTFFLVFFQAVEGLAVVEEVGAEGLDSFVGFFLLGGDGFPFGHFGVVIDCSGKGG